MFSSDILAEIPARLCSPLHNSNFSNGSHFGRVSGQSSAENTQDETATFATIIFLVVIFHGRHFQKSGGAIYFPTDILAKIPAPFVHPMNKMKFFPARIPGGIQRPPDPILSRNLVEI